MFLYYCFETRSVTLRKWYRLRLLTEKGLRKTCGRKRNEVIGDWRKTDWRKRDWRK
jgi:hypothetical protein